MAAFLDGLLLEPVFILSDSQLESPQTAVAKALLMWTYRVGTQATTRRTVGKALVGLHLESGDRALPKRMSGIALRELPQALIILATAVSSAPASLGLGIAVVAWVVADLAVAARNPAESAHDRLAGTSVALDLGLIPRLWQWGVGR